MKYVSLHHHSTFSYGDGYGLPSEHVERAADLGMSAMALTEHGNASSHVQLEMAAQKHGIKPIFGLEAYTAPVTMREDGNQRKWHLTLLAADAEGYRNLMRLITRSWAEGFYRWPTITGPMLAEHSEGLIVLSGCADSKLACDLLGGKGRERGSERDANRTISAFKDLLGDRFYLEVQQFPELERTRTLNGWYQDASKRHGVPLAATADVHYPQPDDNKMQVILHAATRGSGTVASAEAEWEYDIRLTHPQSDKEILKRLRATGLSGPMAEQAVASTSVIAERCNVTLPKVDLLRFPLPDGYTNSSDLIWDLLREGWEYRSARNPRMEQHRDEYVERLMYEMELIEGKKFFDYFLMLSDAVRWAKDNDIPVGPARGSAAASLACYLLRITEIDPLPFPNMLFERFIDVTREDLPDVDLDFDDERRHLLVQRMERVYGLDRVANIGTYTKYKGKNSLDDVARVYGVPAWETKKVKDLIVERSGGDSRVDSTLADTVDMFPQAAEVFDQYPDLWMADRLQGNYKSWSTHAAGLVISNAPITDATFFYSKEDKKTGRQVQVLGLDKYDTEYLGMLKADFLGLTTMGMIRRALEMIGMSLDEMYTLPLDDDETIDAFRRNDVAGIFQFGGGATRVVTGDVKPDNFDELCDINALSRPGPLHSGTTNDYIAAKWGRKKAEVFHPFVTDVTRLTKGQIIYQEQILAIIREMGGLPWAQVAQIRKVISLKKGEGAFNEKKQDFIDGCKANYNVDEELAVRIWNRMVTAGQYAFNASHCVSYSMLAYWQMWLKVHHPTAFYAASLAKASKEQEYWVLRDAIKHDVKIKPPTLDAGLTWQPGDDGTSVEAGLEQVAGIGDKMAGLIIKDREEEGPFANWHSLTRVKGIGPRKVELITEMINSDDPFGIHRIDNILADLRGRLKRREWPLPVPTHRATDIPTDAQRDLPLVFIGIPIHRNPQDVLEDERARTGLDIEECRKRLGLKETDNVKKMAVVAIDDTDETVYLRFPRRTFLGFEKQLWRMKLEHDVVLVKGKRLSKVMGRNIIVQDMWVIDPD